MDFDLSTLLAVFIPLSLLIGLAASAIGFTAWPLVVPLLFVVFKFDLYLTIAVSLAVDCGNALVISIWGISKREAAVPLALKLAALACFFVVPGIWCGKWFIHEHEDFFRGTVAVAAFAIGVGFIVRGFRLDASKKKPVALARWAGAKQAYLIAGTAGTGFLTGLVGIGSGANYAILLMLSRSFPARRATTTAMIVTFLTTLFTVVAMLSQLPEGTLVGAGSLGLGAIIAVMSMAGTALGARLTFRLSEKRVSYLIGAVVLIAGIAATVQKSMM